jgi:hypothetical protein
MTTEQLKSGYFQVRLGIGELVIEKNMSETTSLNHYLIRFTDEDIFESLDPFFQEACHSRQMLVRRVLDDGKKEVLGFPVISKSVQGLVQVRAWTFIPPEASMEDVEKAVWVENKIKEDTDARKLNTNYVILSYKKEEIEATVDVYTYLCCFSLKARKAATPGMTQAIKDCKGINENYRFQIFKKSFQLKQDMLVYGFKLVSTEIETR